MKSKNKKVSGYMRIPRSIATSKQLSHTDKIIWTVIADKVDISEHFNNTRHISLSITQIAKEQSVSRSTAKKSIDRLILLGILEREPASPGYEDKYTVPDDDVIDSMMKSVEAFTAEDFSNMKKTAGMSAEELIDYYSDYYNMHK